MLKTAKNAHAWSAQHSKLEVKHGCKNKSERVRECFSNSGPPGGASESWMESITWNEEKVLTQIHKGHPRTGKWGERLIKLLHMCDLWFIDGKGYIDISVIHVEGVTETWHKMFFCQRTPLNPLQVCKTPKTPMERTHSTKWKHFPENSPLPKVYKLAVRNQRSWSQNPKQI